MSEAKDVVHELNQTVDPNDTKARYLAYLGRLRAIALATTKFVRYTAYASDVGEAFRPVIPAGVVRFTYFISWAYIFGDVGYVTFKANQSGLDEKKVARVATERFVFQSLASLVLPAITIHTTVHAAQRLVKNQALNVRRIVPTVAGLCVVPFLPVMFDNPAEMAVETAFEKVFGPNPFPLHHINVTHPAPEPAN